MGAPSNVARITENSLPCNEVAGRMSAEQMRAAPAGEAIPADPRDVPPAPASEASRDTAEAERAADPV